MTFDMLGQLNWLAVIVGAVVYWILGAVWYAPPVLGRAWQRSIGWQPEPGAPGFTPTQIVLSLVAYLVTAAAIGMLAAATGTADFTAGLTMGVVVGVGFTLARGVVDAVFDPQKPERWTWFAITSGYHFVGIVIVAVLISVWP